MIALGKQLSRDCILLYCRPLPTGFDFQMVRSRLTFSRRRLPSSRRLGSSRYDKYPLFQAVGGEIMIGIDKNPPPFA